MEILAVSAANPGSHDGCVACVADGRLLFSLEAEKDSRDRFAPLSDALVLRALAKLSRIPDVLVQSGAGRREDFLGGYLGLEETPHHEFAFFKTMSSWHTSHELCHIFCTYGLSPFEQGRPCYVLVWEGVIGTFYKVDENLRIEKLGTPMTCPGQRYQSVWALANAQIGYWYDLAVAERGSAENATAAWKRFVSCLGLDSPGKIMALAAFADASSNDDPAVAALVRHLISMEVDEALIWEPQARLSSVLEALQRGEPFRHLSVQDQLFRNIAHRLSDAIYDVFYRFANEYLRERLPLLIAGGCGLNCTWNTAWKNCGLFPDTFVPPCTNDSGIAIGGAIAAQHHFTRNAKVTWSVMAGEEFVVDADLGAQADFVRQSLDCIRLARLLAANAVVCWVQGKYEMGPRALGHRSILAAPFDASMLDRLNKLKKRESYRPIAPICLEEDVGEHFDWSGPSPYMLHFQRLRTDRLRAVTHVDGTARVQTVNEREDAPTYRLLQEFKRQTGFGVLCNTSLNFKGKGFINRASDLLRFAQEEDIDALVINDEMLIRRAALSRYL